MQTAIGTDGNCFECKHYNRKFMRCGLDHFKISLKEAKVKCCDKFEREK
jgi:hypothetical protein